MALALQILVILACLLLGVHYGGIGLGLISGVGLVILVFVFGLTPGEPPVDVMLTILAVIGCASVLQGAGGLNVMMQFAEKILRRHPKYITILAPITTWTLTLMCGTGHVVYTMFPIIGDIAIKNNIRPERPMAAASVASQMGITASPVSVATVSLVSILAKGAGVGQSYSIPQILMISIPASLSGVLLAALWSMRRGKDLDDDPEFQRKIADPDQFDLIYATDETLLTQRFTKEAFLSTWIFFAGIAAVVVLGAFASLRPSFVVGGETEKLSMNLVIQMAMLVAGALILVFCKVKASEVNNGAVFKAGMTAIFAVYGVAWMADTFFSAHIDALKESLAGVVQGQPWTYAIVLFIVSKLVNSQAAALVAIAPIGLALGVEPTLIIAFFGASYGYFVLPTYPSDLACIGFDRTGTTHIGKYVINHSFIIPGLISVFTSCVVGYTLVSAFL
ncbi:MAG TPA: anaerobic C4-dicarboxylate transporter [Dermatophilaceae bacterium]|nr:anaerobic C4-dicarboxylate transporter [Dermatophilaceae bacterium]